MTGVLAAAVMFATSATALSLFTYLPALAVVESVPPRRPAVRAAVWLAALVVPALGGAAAATLGLWAATHDKYGSPHLGAPRPHLCSRWVTLLPDGRLIIQLVGVACGALVVAAAVRLVWSAARSSALARRFRRAETENGQMVVVEDAVPLVAAVGAFRPVVVVTTEALEALSGREAAAALAHETAHVHRRDGLVELAVSACRTCLLFVPTVHLFARYWHQEVERACDDAAARAASPEVVASAMAKLAAVGRARTEQRPIAPADRGWRHSALDVAARAARLLANEPDLQPAAGSAITVGGLLAALGILGAVTLGALATAQQAQDTLYCMAESLLAVLRK